MKVALAVLAGLAALGLFCCLGSLALGMFSLDDATPSPVAAAQGTRTDFALKPPATFTTTPQGHWRRETKDDLAQLWLDVQRLQPIPGLDDAQNKVSTLWAAILTNHYEGVTDHPLVMRRFVANGARAHFASALLINKKDHQRYWLSLYLVEADDHLEPFLFTQGCVALSMGSEMIIEFSWPKSHVFVEDFITGIYGSPTGLPLLEDDEVTGHFTFGDNSTAQWINTVTGATSMTAVARAIEYTFADDGTYTYSFVGGSGQVGAIKFGTDKDEGTWKVEHDLLVLTGQKWQRKLLIHGAPRGPQGQRMLLLQSEPYTFAPGSIGDVFIEK